MGSRDQRSHQLIGHWNRSADPQQQLCQGSENTCVSSVRFFRWLRDRINSGSMQTLTLTLDHTACESGCSRCAKLGMILPALLRLFKPLQLSLYMRLAYMPLAQQLLGNATAVQDMARLVTKLTVVLHDADTNRPGPVLSSESDDPDCEPECLELRAAQLLSYYDSCDPIVYTLTPDFGLSHLTALTNYQSVFLASDGNENALTRLSSLQRLNLEVCATSGVALAPSAALVPGSKEGWLLASHPQQGVLLLVFIRRHKEHR
ncbi:hypothetical protein WJX73_000100 [Symbiochloris irregularis]|uniref:Uncharacterized protein n=1 Tax=Symbiochloris irregularis TaxID=706552 RepID=A0AAW1NQ45_9CHLO